MTLAAEALEACPFCNGKAEISRPTTLYQIRCRSCLGGTALFRDFPPCRAAWNTRALRAQPSREDVARVIDPWSMQTTADWIKRGRDAAESVEVDIPHSKIERNAQVNRASMAERRQTAYAKADAVIALTGSSAGEREAVQLLRMLIAADEEAAPNGVMDCIDNDGSPYQSAAMAGVITHARLLVQPYDHAAALAEYRAAQPASKGVREI